MFKPVAETLAGLRFPFAKKIVLGNTMSEQTQIEIHHIKNVLITARKNPHKIEKNRNVTTSGKINL